jgi:sorbitol-specific phosphotransferase system component IIA
MEPNIIPKNITIKRKSLNTKCPNGTRRNKQGICIKSFDDTVVTNVPVSNTIIINEPSPNVAPNAPLSKTIMIKKPRPTVAPTTVIHDNNLTQMSKLSNEHRRKLEKKEYDDTNDDEYSFLYPSLNDPSFAQKIAAHTEFDETRYDGELHNIQEYADIMCEAEFEPLPHQLFVKNFLSSQTPYNSLLLYHGLGSGKTCSAIGISEEMRSYMKQVGIKQRIIVVASPNVQSNFKLQLFDERKLREIDGIWNIDSCIGNLLIKEVNPTNLKGVTKERIISQIKTIINQYYVFMGYVELSNYIRKKTSVPENAQYNIEDTQKHERANMRKFFNNRMIIIDEVHNIRLTKDNNKNNSTTAQHILKLAKYCSNMRFLLLSATPMYNSYSEIIWLVNLMNSNDKRGIITQEEVFSQDGKFKEPKLGDNGKIIEEGGRELLQRKLIGYVSYVRGENPYTFPYRIYPNTFAPERTFKYPPAIIGSLVKAGQTLMGNNNVKFIDLPTTQLNGRNIEELLKNMPVYITRLGEYQEKAYKLVINGIRKDIINNSNLSKSFEELDKFGFRRLQTPIEALNMVYPSENLDMQIERGELISDDSIVYEDNKDPRATMVGKRGMNTIMTYTDESMNKNPSKYNFEYRPHIEAKYGRIFSQSEISKYSAKIARICEVIRHSTGIVIIYSQYIDGGIVPMSLALEEMGFLRHGTSSNTKSLFKNPPTEQLNAIDMLPKSKTRVNFRPARYTMITGDGAYSPQNSDDMKVITNTNNKNGEIVKVVLISKAGAEGLDFKCVRQLHILEPWYNMNRIEQVIGRGVRNLSHCLLPFNMRNVEIYMHGSILKNSPLEEAVDVYMYRTSKKKAELIGQVTRLLKETSVDCILNIKQTNFTISKLLEIPSNKDTIIQLSTDKKEIPYQIGDRPYTDLCDYMEDCSFKCNIKDGIKLDKVQETYSTSYSQSNNDRIMRRIRQIFRDEINGKSFYTLKQLIEQVNIVKQYPITQIYSALTSFVKNKTEYLFDRYGRRGNMVNKLEIYSFQPIEINDEHITVFERSTPIDYKNISVNMEIPQEFPSKIQEYTNVTTAPNTYNNILRMIEENIKYGTTVQSLDQGEQNWYKHASHVINHLQVLHAIGIVELIDHFIRHSIDYLMPNEKLIMISHFYSKIHDASDFNEIETVIKAYLDTKLMTYNNKSGFIIASQNNWNLYIQSVYDTSEWVIAEPEDIRNFENDGLFKQFKKDSSRFSNIIGFIDMFKTGKDMVFRIKNVTQMQNNTGTRLSGGTPGKGDIIKYLNEILGSQSNTTYNIANTKGIMQFGLCVIVEIILRQRTNDNLDGQIWFLNPEEAEYNRIAKYRRI